jgi:DNA-binding transcriptional ArsR family regulator
MQQPRPGLLPLFRSATQLEILGLLFTGAGRSWTVGEIAGQLGLGVPTVSKEVARLNEARIVKLQAVGRSRLVSANWDLPWAEPLARLLERTIGPLEKLSEALAGIPGVGSAWVYGSWAERYNGVIGGPPKDVDVIVVGEEVDLLDLTARLDRVADQVAVPVNSYSVTQAEWDHPRPGTFVDQVKRSALVPVALHARG